ncbi:MAG: HAD-superfamily hydrolase, subfamily [Verrucomicrobiaceae bacterium]|nr:HAD-superfamily hydrolase, subfamily [Verrucomicrobiaceae bacterium]
MKWLALATDFDGTLATEGVVSQTTTQALAHARQCGLITLLVTGRELRDFADLGFDLKWFNLVVAENGAVLFDPHSGVETLLAPPPPIEFVEELRRQGVAPLSVGMTIVATFEPHEVTVLETIKQMGLELVVTFNKGSVMILPPGINKASGLAAALDVLDLPAEAVVGVGDAENDHAFLKQCGLAVAVANALPSLQEYAGLVTEGAAGEGVTELIGKILNDELEALHPQPAATP